MNRGESYAIGNTHEPYWNINTAPIRKLKLIIMQLMPKLIKIYNLWLIGISIPYQQTNERPQTKLNGEANYSRFEAESSESGYFPNRRVRDKRYIPLQPQKG